MSRLGTESAFEVLARARALEKQGRSIVHLEIGEPDFPTPEHIREAAKKALDDGWTKYGPTQGDPALRESIANYISRTRGIRARAENVCVTPGAKPILFFVLTALIEEGDEVIYPDPGFPIYESMIRFQGGVAKPIPLLEKRGFSLDLDQFQALLTPKTKLVVLNSPHNPTGGVIPREDVARLAEMLRDRDVMVLSDEIYSRICFGQEPVSIASFEGMAEKTVIVDGFSKTYSMTGWRLGYGVMPEWLAKAVVMLMVNSNSCTASFVQRAGIAALEGPQDCVDAMVEEFRRRRDAITAALNQIPGFRAHSPAGTFYSFPSIADTGIRSKAMADLLMNEAGVACLDGAAFGRYGDGYVRFSCANSLENIHEAVRRIHQVSERWASAVSSR